MRLATENHMVSRPARIALCAILCLHAVLLVAMLPDYFADNDLGYHISLGRQFGEHGGYFWDSLNWVPTGRPNLHGPLLHGAIGLLGRILGGEGGDYILAFSLLSLLQWAAAMFTAIWFARRWGGDRAALFAAAILSGGIWSGGAFFVGIPSGWIFILTPWAIHFFLEERYLASALLATAVTYVHLGGAVTAGFGILLAAVFTRRWKPLLRVGAITLVLSAPYLGHFFAHLRWYSGQRGHVAGWVNLLAYVLAIPGLWWLGRRPRANLFLLVWPFAALAWLFQDPLRFFQQSSIAASVIGAVFVAGLFTEETQQGLRRVITVGIVALATVFPLSMPSLPVEAAWAAGHGFPRQIDWTEARTLAEAVDEAGLSHKMVSSYYDSLSAAMAVYTPLSQEYGYWGEVRPRIDPAQDISAGEKLYVLPLPPDDPKLRELQAAGWITVRGGSARTTLATLPKPAPLGEAAAVVAGTIHTEAAWLARHAVNNTMPPFPDRFEPAAIQAHRRTMSIQRTHAGRIEVAVLLYAYALENSRPEVARRVRQSARQWGIISNFIGDETAIDYIGATRFERFRVNLARYGQLALALRHQPAPTRELDELTDKLFRDFFG